jgi:phosphohistidine phosphatase
MRRLILVRHAKAEAPVGGISDFERVLLPSGEQEARRVAQRLGESGLSPQRILTSSAPRALRTAEILADACGVQASDFSARQELYLASPGAMLEMIGREADDVTALMLVTHNPGISALAASLGGQPGAELPTAAVVVIDWPDGPWSGLTAAAGRLVYFDHPQKT